MTTEERTRRALEKARENDSNNRDATRRVTSSVISSGSDATKSRTERALQSARQKDRESRRLTPSRELGSDTASGGSLLDGLINSRPAGSSVSGTVSSALDRFSDRGVIDTFSDPDKWDTASEAEAGMQRWSGELASMEQQLTERADALTNMETQLQRLQQTAGSQDDIEEYNRLYGDYESGREEYNALAENYNRTRDRYASGLQRYQDILGSGMDRANQYTSEADMLEARNAELDRKIQRYELGVPNFRDNYAGASAIERLNELKAERDENQRRIALLRAEAEDARMEYYSSLRMAEDWEENSASLGSQRAAQLSAGETPYYAGGVVYDYINDIGGARGSLNGYDDTGTQYAAYGTMTPDEIGIYNYLYATQGREAAEQFLSTIRETLNYRLGAQNYENMSGLGKALYWIPAGLSQFSSGIEQLFSREAVPTSPTLYTSSMIQQEAQERSPVLGTLYELGTTLSNMAPSVLASALGGWALGGTGMAAGTAARVAGAGGSALLGASAGGNAYTQALNEGYEPDEARTYATLVGASEGALQYLLGGIQSLGGAGVRTVASKIGALDNVLGRIARTSGGRLIGSMISEGTEEGIQELLEPAFRTLIFDEEYDANFSDAAYSFLLGALSAGIIEGASNLSARTGGRNDGFTLGDMDGFVGENGVNYFEGCDTFYDVETRYHDLARQYHPDLGGDTATMAEINRQHTMARAFFQGRGDTAEETERSAGNAAEAPAERTGQPDGIVRALSAHAETPALTAQESIQRPTDRVTAGGGIVLPTAEETGAVVLPTAEDFERASSPENITGGNINGRAEQADEISGGDRGRLGSGRPGGQAGQLVEGSGGRAAAFEQGRTAIERQNRAGHLRLKEVSTSSLGVPEGTDTPAVRVLPEEEWDKELQRTAEDVYWRTGKEVKYVLGALEVHSPDGTIRRVRGVWRADGAIIVQADNMRVSVQQIAEHETYHEIAAQNPGTDYAVEERIREQFGDEEFERVVETYIQKLHGIIDLPANAGEAEFEAALARVKQEIYADAYAGINAFGAHAERFRDVTRETVEERTRGEYRGDNEEATQSRRGPPVERDSRAGVNAASAEPEQRRVTPPDTGDGDAAFVDEDLPARYSIDENYERDIDDWNSRGRPDGEVFILGRTGDVLQGLGAREQDIYLRSEKVNNIMQKHPEMTLNEIKRIPEVLDEPVLVLSSSNAGRRGRNSRLVIFSEVRAQNGQPIMAVLDLQPVENRIIINDMQKVNSAYTRNNAENYIRKSEVLYADEDKAMSLLSRIENSQSASSSSRLAHTGSGGLLRSGYVGSISYENGRVNIEGVPFDEMVGTSNASQRYSVSEDADNEALKREVDRLQKELDMLQRKEAAAQERKLRQKERQESRRQAQREKRMGDSIRQSENMEDPPRARAVIAQRELKRQLLDLFSIPNGQRNELGSFIDNFAERLVRNGEYSEQDRRELLDRLYDSGVMTVEADPYYAAGREAIRNRRMFVNDTIRAEIGDWNDFRKRAFAAGVYLTNNTADMSVEQWNIELAEMLPGLFNAEETDLRRALERIIQIAEEGKDEQVSLAEYTQMLAGENYVSEDEILDGLEQRADWEIRTFAQKADLEIKLRNREARREVKDRVRRQESARRRREDKELRELQEKTLKQIQWLARNQYRTPEDLKRTWDDVLGDIDIYAISAADELNWSRKYGATWKNLADMYAAAKERDPNFLPSAELEKIYKRLNSEKIGDMDIGALQDLYKAAVGLRTEFYNRNNVINDENRRLFANVYAKSKEEINSAPGGYSGKKTDNLFNLEQLTPMNVMERMAGWNPGSAWYSMAQQLERGEENMRAYTVEANEQLADFLEEHEDWVRRSDGQGQDSIWYEIEVPELLELGMGDKPIFGDSVKVYMTPSQKVQLYLESKNYDNLRHMVGGRTFADKRLYSEGKRSEAYAQGKTIRLAPETVRHLVENLTDEERELAKLLESYYNDFAAQRINAVSNALYGYDKAVSRNYAPIYTNSNYRKNELGVYDVTAEGVGSLKSRVRGAKNPSYNISAYDAFERHMGQTARFVGMAIPARNMKTLLNWQEQNDGMREVITHKWGKETLSYVENMITELEGGRMEERLSGQKAIDSVLNNYVSATFGFNPSVVLKQLGSIPLASAYLGARNIPSPAQIWNIDYDFISKYTKQLDWRLMGYSTPETKRLKENPNWTQRNKFLQTVFGGGSITWMDGFASSTLWPWAENKVRREHPEIEVGTPKQVESGQSPFYQEVAKEFNNAVSRSQSMADQMHRSIMGRSRNPIIRAFTMFKSDSAQLYNALRQKIGEARYYKRTNAAPELQHRARTAAGTAFVAALVGFAWVEAVNLLINLWKYGGKNYRDDDDELTAESVLQTMIMDMFSSMAGTVVFGQELADIIGNILTGDTWYGVDIPGGEQLNDALKSVLNAGNSIKEILGGATDIIANGGDLGEYLSDNGAAIAGGVKELAAAVATYFRGIPVNNVEKYITGLLRLIAPGAVTAYEDVFAEPSKSDLDELSGDALSTRIMDMLANKGVEINEATAAALGALYSSGETSAVPSATPNTVTVDGESIELDAYRQQLYDRAWSEAIGGSLDELISSPDFAAADVEAQSDMVSKLYRYASEKAKQAAAPTYEPAKFVGEVEEKISNGSSLAEWALWDVISADVSGTFDQLTDEGLDYEPALEVAETLNDLDKDAATTEKYMAIAMLPISESEKDMALEAIMSDSAYERYERARSAGIDTYDYCTFLDTIADYTGDGRQEMVWSYIDSMPLTSAQKDALHLAAGYKESTLSKTPWH